MSVTFKVCDFSPFDVGAHEDVENIENSNLGLNFLQEGWNVKDTEHEDS